MKPQVTKLLHAEFQSRTTGPKNRFSTFTDEAERGGMTSQTLTALLRFMKKQPSSHTFYFYELQTCVLLQYEDEDFFLEGWNLAEPLKGWKCAQTLFNCFHRMSTCTALSEPLS